MYGGGNDDTYDPFNYDDDFCDDDNYGFDDDREGPLGQPTSIELGRGMLVSRASGFVERGGVLFYVDHTQELPWCVVWLYPCTGSYKISNSWYSAAVACGGCGR